MIKKTIGLEGREVMNFAAMKKNLARAQRERERERQKGYCWCPEYGSWRKCCQQ